MVRARARFFGQSLRCADRLFRHHFPEPRFLPAASGDSRISAFVERAGPGDYRPSCSSDLGRQRDGDLVDMHSALQSVEPSAEAVTRSIEVRYARASPSGRLRDELLNETLFRSLPHARAALETWRTDYNTARPHSRLGWLSPIIYAAARRSAALRSADGSAPRTAATTAQQGIRNGQTPVPLG